ncbi:MAG: glycosyltransferase, partial [Kocuria sp.]|nr:glycosyltransferase [Kocuria sp.]
AWSRGAMSTALSILEDAGAHDSLYARRLRSEAQLLEPDFRLPVPKGYESADMSTRVDDEPLRVLHLLTNSLPHTQSGYTLRSHRILTALSDQGIESVALTRTGYPVMIGKPGAAEEDVVDGIRYVRTLPIRLPGTQQLRLEAEVTRALELVKEFRPHVIHATTNYLNALVAQAVSDATGLPWVLEVRGLMEKTWIASHRSEESRAIARDSEKHDLIAAKEGEFASVASAVVTLSKTMASELVLRGADHEAITIVPNGVDDKLFDNHVSTDRAREIVGLDEKMDSGVDPVMVGAVSALVDYEGFDVLLRAAALLLEDDRAPTELRDRLRIVIAGEGVSRPGLLALARELGIQQRVHLPGRVARCEARLWVEALDLVVLPRKDMEVTRAVTPQKPIEAMALARPLILSDLPAVREVISTPEGLPVAVCVPPGDAEALADAILRWWHGANAAHYGSVEARAVASSRSWSVQVRRYRNLYERVTHRTGGGADNGQ